MSIVSRFAASLLLAFVACNAGGPAEACCVTGGSQISLRAFNAFTSPVDVLVDGRLRVGPLAPGGTLTSAEVPGNHTVAFRLTGSTALALRQITLTEGALSTVVAVRSSNGSISSAVLDDTNTVVLPGATKVRVLHLAARAGTLQVYGTSPDAQTPVSWQSAFDYQSEPTSLTAPYSQSTVGSWEIRVWRTPADASGWDSAPVRVVIPLASGEKKTVVILDGIFGPFRAELL